MEVLSAARGIIISDVIDNLYADCSHSMEHFDSVVAHAVIVLDETSLTQKERESVLLASLLHDVDDVKVTKGKYSHLYWAKYVLDKLCVESSVILLMIDIVSCSKNGDSRDESYPWWYYVPRYCDRLEAIGRIGITRLLAYGASVGRPIHYVDTVRVHDRDELRMVAKIERYAEYTKGGKKGDRVSSIDIIYDKLYHISLPPWMCSPYLERMFAKRKEYISEWVINYWLCEDK